MENIENILTEIILDYSMARIYLDASTYDPQLALYELKGDGWAIRGKTRQALVTNLVVLARLWEDSSGRATV